MTTIFYAQKQLCYSAS